MAVEKFYKDSNGDYVKVIQKSETLSASEEANLRNKLQGKKPSVRKKITNKIKNAETTSGRPIYKDPETGENYSERSTTFQMENGKWLTIPTVNTSGGQFDVGFLEDFVRRNGAKDPLTGRALPTFDSEPEATAYAKERSNSLVPQRTVSKGLYDKKGRFRGADYKSGVTNDAFRRQFARTNTFKEKTNYLDQQVGKEGYVVDKMGNFLLTPKGQQNLQRSRIGNPLKGSSGNNLLAIDAAGLEGEDFSEFVGEFGDVVAASIYGEVKADQAFKRAVSDKSKTKKLFKKGFLGKTAPLAEMLGKGFRSYLPGTLTDSARIAANAAGAGAGAYVGNVLNEGQQFIQQIQEESMSDVFSRGVREAKLAGGFSVLGNAASMGARRLIRGRKASKLTEEVYGKEAYERYKKTGILKADENTIMDRIQRGYINNIFEEIDNPTRARLFAALDQITLGRIKRDKINIKNVFKEIKETFPRDLDNISDSKLQEIIEVYVKDGGESLKNTLKQSREEVGGSIADSLSGILNLAQKGDLPIEDIAEMYDVVNQAAALGSIEAMRVADVLGKKAFKNVDQLFVGIEEAVEMMAKNPRKARFAGSSNKATENLEDYVKNLYETGGKNSENLRFLMTDDGKIALMSDGGSQNFIGTSNITNTIKQVKKDFPEALIEEGGPLAKIWNNIDKDGNTIRPLFISATESNLLIQQMRRISLDGVQGSKFDTRKLWDAAILDNDQASAALDNVINLGKKGKIIPSQSLKAIDSSLGKAGLSAPSFKASINKGLSQMDEYNSAVKELTIDNKTQMEMFEKYGLGELAVRVANGDANYTDLVDVLLDPNKPENLETFIEYFTETVKKGQQKIYNPSVKMGKEYKDIALDSAGQPIKTVTGPQATAFDAILEGPMQSEISEVIFRPGSRAGEKLTAQKKINFVDSNMSTKEIETFIRNEIGRATLYKMLNKNGGVDIDNVRQVIKELGNDNYGSGKPGSLSSLESIFGKETANKVKDFGKRLNNVVLGFDRLPKNLADELKDSLTTVEDALKNGSTKNLDEALDSFKEAQQKVTDYDSNAFYNMIQKNGYRLPSTDGKIGEPVFAKFIDDLFSDNVPLPELQKIINNLKSDELEQLQSRLMDNFFRDLGFDSLGQTDELDIKEIVNAFKDSNVRRVLGSFDPQTFNIIFKGTANNPFEQLSKILKAAKISGKTNDMGSLIATAYAVMLAGAPLTLFAAIPTFSSAAFGALGLIAMKQGIEGLGTLFRKPWFLKALTESTLPQAGNTVPDKIRYFNRSLETYLRNSARDKQSDKEKLGPNARKLKAEKIDIRKGGVPALLENAKNIPKTLVNIGSEVAELGPNIATNVVRQFGAKPIVSRSSTSRRLPNVQTFDDTVFTELERRRALAGSNPNTQDIAGRK